MSIKKILSLLVTVLSIMMIFWFAASYLDVITHNLDEHPTYQVWNVFQLMVDYL